VHTVDRENVSATLTVACRRSVFAVRGRTRRPLSAIDGSRLGQESVDLSPLTEAGRFFRMDMIPRPSRRDYQTANKVHVLDPPPSIVWLPGSTPRATVT